MMDDLDAWFATAKSAAMQPSEALMARVLADAEAVQPWAAQSAARPPQRVGFFATVAALFGGTGALAGMGSAAIAGLFFGIVQPAGIGTMTGLVASGTIDSVELVPDIDALLAGE